jgi:hypothetical protein
MRYLLQRDNTTRQTLAALLAVLAFAAPSACSQGGCDPKISRECFR